MRILILSTFFPPLNSIASLRPYSWAKYWSEAGHEVVVATTYKGEKCPNDLDFSLQGFKIIEAKLPKWASLLKKNGESVAQKNVAEGNGLKNWLLKPIKKLIDRLRFKNGILNACRFPDLTHLWISPILKQLKSEAPFDFAISTAGPYPVHLAAHKLKKTGIVKVWIADYRDTWSNNYIYPGLFPFNYLENIIEKRILKNADFATTVSAPFAEQIQKAFNLDDVHVIENGFDRSDIDALPKESIFIKDHTIRIVHTGSIYLAKRDPTPLFEALKTIGKERLKGKIEVIFAGERQANLQDLISQYELEDLIRLTGAVSRKDALRMQRDADFLLFLPWKDTAVDGVMTGKLFEYLFSGTPIIAVGATALEASQALILEAEAGLTFLSKEAIVEFLNDLLFSQKSIKIAPKDEVLKNYDRKYLAGKVLDLAVNEVCP